MRILVTGASGNIGGFLIEELLKRKYCVRCFVLPDEKKKALSKDARIDVFYGDIRNAKDIKNAISGCNAVIHLAFTSPDICEDSTDFAHSVNIDGTKNLVDILKENPTIKLIFPSSISAYFFELYCKTRKISFLRYKKYAEQKLECEDIIKSSLSNWSILRIGAVLPTNPPALKDILSIPSSVRFRFVCMKDVVIALTNAIENNKSKGKTFLIGGDKGFCMQYKKFANDMFSIQRTGLPENKDFSSQPYLTECFDTKKSQEILKYQKCSYKEFLLDMKKQIVKIDFLFIQR